VIAIERGDIPLVRFGTTALVPQEAFRDFCALHKELLPSCVIRPSYSIRPATEVHPELINGRFAYVSISRASQDARIYTNNATTLAESLSRDVSKTSAINIEKIQGHTQDLVNEATCAIKESGFELALRS
jgi:hypothetical protein